MIQLGIYWLACHEHLVYKVPDRMKDIIPESIVSNVIWQER